MPDLTQGKMLLSVRVVDPTSGRGAYGSFRVDTGDDVALVDPAILAAIGASLTPTGTVGIVGVDGQPINAPSYLLDLDLGPDGYLPGVTLVAMPLGGLGYSGLIGVNVLKRGLLMLDGPDGEWQFTVGPPKSASVAWLPWTAVGAGLGLLGAAVFWK